LSKIASTNTVATSADGHAHRINDVPPDQINIFAGGQIHDGIGSVLDGILHFGDFATAIISGVTLPERASMC